MLARGPRKVIALDMNPSQLACLDLRVAAFRRLEHAEILELIGSSPASAVPNFTNRYDPIFRQERARSGTLARGSSPKVWDTPGSLKITSGSFENG
jgi:S-adenosylmethionine:diacylglycerol 3-amino-3-carboxypropyl transferase